MWGDRRDPRGGPPQHIGHRGGTAGAKGGMGPLGPPGFLPPPGLWADPQGHGLDPDHLGGGAYSDAGQGPPLGQMAMGGPGGRRQTPMQAHMQGIYRGKGGKDGMVLPDGARRGVMPPGGPHYLQQHGFNEQDYGVPPGMHGPGLVGSPSGRGPPGGKGGNIPFDQTQFKEISF